MSNGNILFVGGIHGVGKGTICTKLAAKYGFQHLTASEVLKWNEISDRINKRVQDITSTQERLISNLNSIVKQDETYLLDGHFALLNSQGVPEKIQDSTFERINPTAVILLTDEPERILGRLNKRDNSGYALETLEEMQEMEIEHADHITKKLNIPLIKVKNNDVHALYSYLDSQ